MEKNFYKLIVVNLLLSIAIFIWSSLACGLTDGVSITGEKVITLKIAPNKKRNLSSECFSSDGLDVNKKHTCSNYQNFNKSSPIIKKIKLNSVNLSYKFMEKLADRFEKINVTNNKDNYEKLNYLAASSGGLKKDLGMANVPVLDQGLYGTCATFATTAVIDALKKSGDYISQQCLLELGKDEEFRLGLSSGWEGAFFETILERMGKYGVISKSSCPHQYADFTQIMGADTYVAYSKKKWANGFNWKLIETTLNDGFVESNDLKAVKKHIDSGHRVLIGALLIEGYDHGLPLNDEIQTGLWTLPPGYNIEQFEEDYANNKIGGHAVIVTGYDDVKKLLKIRNSWGTSFGDNGDYYMTYDYFYALNVDAIAIY